MTSHMKHKEFETINSKQIFEQVTYLLDIEKQLWEKDLTQTPYTSNRKMKNVQREHRKINIQNNKITEENSKRS